MVGWLQHHVQKTLRLRLGSLGGGGSVCNVCRGGGRRGVCPFLSSTFSRPFPSHLCQDCGGSLEVALSQQALPFAEGTPRKEKQCRAPHMDLRSSAGGQDQPWWEAVAASLACDFRPFPLGLWPKPRIKTFPHSRGPERSCSLLSSGQIPASVPYVSVPLSAGVTLKEHGQRAGHGGRCQWGRLCPGGRGCLGYSGSPIRD